MAKLTHLKVNYEQNNVVLFTATINGKEKECIAKRFDSVKNPDGSGKVYEVKIASSGIDIASRYFWGGYILQSNIIDLLNSGLKEWNLKK